MAKKKHIHLGQWHERPAIPWLIIPHEGSQEDPPAWVQKYLDLADVMLKSGKKAEPKIDRSKAA